MHPPMPPGMEKKDFDGMMVKIQKRLPDAMDEAGADFDGAIHTLLVKENGGSDTLDCAIYAISDMDESAAQAPHLNEFLASLVT